MSTHRLVRADAFSPVFVNILQLAHKLATQELERLQFK